MLVVKILSRCQSYKKFAAILVRPTVGHRKQILSLVLQNKVFVGEVQTVYRLSSCAVVKVDISTVGHLISDAVENCVVV